jgi:hypothetical protein
LISGDDAVMGLSWVDGMCSAEQSCSVNEGRSFRSVFVMAHELAHNFGVGHDGDRGAEQCGPGVGAAGSDDGSGDNSNNSILSAEEYIMSESDGPGKTTWSKCSKAALAAGFKSV